MNDEAEKDELRTQVAALQQQVAALTAELQPYRLQAANAEMQAVLERHKCDLRAVMQIVPRA